MKKQTIIFILTILPFLLFGAELELTQTVKGRVLDADSKMPIIGATVVVENSNPIQGTITDIDGYFRLEGVPIGRINLLVKYMGYEDKLVPNILVQSAKQVNLDIEIVESAVELDAVKITGKKKKAEAINEMAILSTQTFSIEEASKYAGSFNDPARMAASFAGVSSNAEGSNEIIVRGNSPKGILWRLEGVDIPNPNHFADEGSTGGPINVLNSSMLSNSDFLTGAFSPEYGNALSGVFDLRMRSGNADKAEYGFGFGVMGTDFTAEGPFKKGGKSSYLMNYRYSTLAILDDAGIVDFGGVPKYQDASFKVKLPTKKAGQFSIFGMGGISNIHEEYQNDEGVTAYKGDYGSHVGVLGVSNSYFLNKQSYWKNTISMSSNGSIGKGEMIDSNDVFKYIGGNNMVNNQIKYTTVYNNKLNARNTIKIGGIYTSMDYSFVDDYVDENDVLIKAIDENDKASYTQAYVSWKHRFNDKLTMVGGLHGLHFQLNDTYSIEPRIGFRWKAADRWTFNGGYGKHSKTESLLNYTVQVNGVQQNLNLELPKAHHFVVGVDYLLNEFTHLKFDFYYQYLFDIPVENDSNSQYSLLNAVEWFTERDLVNEGFGYNRGVEATLERFYENNFYYLITASVYESQYKSLASDWRSGRFDARFNSNFLIGKEWGVGKEDKNALGASLKMALLGGNRITPIDLDQSQLEGRQVRVKETYSGKADDVFFANIAGYYRINNKKTTHEIKFEVLNATNNQAVTNEYYHSGTGKIETSKQLPLIPNLMYTVLF